MFNQRMEIYPLLDDSTYGFFNAVQRRMPKVEGYDVPGFAKDMVLCNRVMFYQHVQAKQCKTPHDVVLMAEARNELTALGIIIN
jgi:hypothetical protein